MQALLDYMGRQLHDAHLEFVAPSGARWTLGHGWPRATIELRCDQVLRRILMHPRYELAAAYVRGDWQPAGGDLMSVLEVATRIQMQWEAQRRPWWQRSLSWLGERNSSLRARSNVHAHYDREPEFYGSFLDADWHYSCGYFAGTDRNPDQNLDAAQQAKCERIARKLDLQPEASVLDIGCGFGSLAMYLARHQRARVVGVTLSTAQLEHARERLRASGLQRRVELRLQDYRHVREQFDAVVSVGMFEHVGRPQYVRYFRTVFERLRPGGTALVHTIGRSGPPTTTNPWIRRNIFPGGYIPAATEAMAAIEPSGLVLCDLDVWRQHYALTLLHWHRRFEASRERWASRWGEAFCRGWEFYLRASEASFRWGDLVVFQFQLARRPLRLPITRGYIDAPGSTRPDRRAQDRLSARPPSRRRGQL